MIYDIDKINDTIQTANSLRIIWNDLFLIDEMQRNFREINEKNDEHGPDDIEKWDSLGQLSLISSLESHYRTTFETEV